MHAGERYTFIEFLYWTRRDTIWLLVLSTLPVLMYDLLGWKWVAMPWVPIAMVGTAAAFIVGFRNNATYDRMWEGRTVWGGIVNTSRTWGIQVRDLMLADAHEPAQAVHERLAIQRQLIYRHLAWLTALRHQLRQPRIWESIGRIENKEYRRLYTIPEHQENLATELAKYLTAEEASALLTKKNIATQLIALQSAQLKDLTARNLLDRYSLVELERTLKDMYDGQGRCERIKNFPYPRQFASVNLFFIRLFLVLVPFGMLGEFARLGDHSVWLAVPFSTVVGWMFYAMEKIGVATENPFEGGANDVPISALCRTIEIDLREMLNEKEIPEPLQPENNILM